MAQTATLRALGAECRLLSLAGTKHHAYGQAEVYPAPSASEHEVASHAEDLLRPTRAGWGILHRRFPRLMNLLRPAGWRGVSHDRHALRAAAEELLRVHGEDRMHDVFGGYDTYVVSFPPSLAHFFLRLAETYDARLVLNLGHRFNIGVKTRTQNEEMFALLRYLHEHPLHVLASGSDYDTEYTRHYLGFEPVKLPFVCLHLPSSPSPAPDSGEPVLVGPGSFHSERRLAETLNRRASQRDRNPAGAAGRYTFSTLRDLYRPSFPRHDHLLRHPAAVILPYSAFSMLMLELYELDIPFFVPSPALLARYRRMKDRALFPIYCSERQYRRLRVGGAAGEPSPNSYEEEAERYWMQFAFFYRTGNAVYFESEDDLLDKLANADLARIRERMSGENRQRREAALAAWKETVLDGRT